MTDQSRDSLTRDEPCYSERSRARKTVHEILSGPLLLSLRES